MTRSRISQVALLALAGLLAVLALSTAARAGETPCWVKVINDWAKDRVIATTYPIACYTEAIKKAPTDLKSYGTFEDDVLRARAAAIKAQSPSPSPSPTPSPSPSPSPSPAPSPAPTPAPTPTPVEPPPTGAPPPSESIPTDTAPLPIEPLPGDSLPTDTAPLPTDTAPTETDAAAPLGGGGDDEGGTPSEPAPAPSAAGPLDGFFTGSTPDDTRSVPVALIVLCAVAGALAFGGASVLGWRAYQARRLDIRPIPGPVGGDPPLDAPTELLRDGLRRTRPPTG